MNCQELIEIQSNAKSVERYSFLVYFKKKKGNERNQVTK